MHVAWNVYSHTRSSPDLHVRSYMEGKLVVAGGFATVLHSSVC